MLIDGDGVKEEFTVGLMWMRKAARRGDDNAQYNLGRAYAKGENGLRISPRYAQIWLSKAAEGGHNKARRLADHRLRLNENA
jgi:TPR repeat protein